jgi:hypothetical protein
MSQPATTTPAPVTTTPSAQPPTDNPAQVPSANPAENAQKQAWLAEQNAPWTMAQAYYGYLKAGNYPAAWNLLDTSALGYSSYPAFVASFANTRIGAVTFDYIQGGSAAFQVIVTNAKTGASLEYECGATIDSIGINSLNCYSQGAP